MAIRFTELNPITTPDDLDVFALTDFSEGDSVHITFANLRDSIVSEDTFEQYANELKNVIENTIANLDVSVSTANNATNLGGQPASYYLEYSNFTNAPAGLSDLTNDNRFVRFDGTYIVYDVEGGAVGSLSSDNVQEGETNLYYSDARVADFFDNNFGDYFTAFTETFDEGNPADSLFGTSAGFIETSGTGDERQSSKIRLTDTSVFENYTVGQTIRIYGATSSVTANKLESTTASFSIGTTFPSGTNVFEYKIASFNYVTGEIAPASATQSVSIGIPEDVPEGTSIYDSFNETFFIRLNLFNVGENQGILLYRKAPNTATFKLIYVMGPKDTSQGVFIDYYNYDWNSWTGKAADNSFSSIVHFPLTPPTESRRGWIDATITARTLSSTTLDLTLDKTVFINTSDTACQLAHNDTALIQTAINTAKNIGKRGLVMSSKRYVVDSISLPDEFGLQGTPNNTRITKLPWSGFTSEDGKLLKSATGTNALNLSIVGIDLDGNALNQILWDDSIESRANYLLDFGVNPIDVVVDKMRLFNPIGGGVYALIPVSMKFTNSEIKDSGLSDRYDYSPIIAGDGSDTIFNANIIRNFTDYCDFSVTDKGMVTNNIIENCGTGILVYGSRYLVSQPNVLIGPANEFIPAPDTLNSEYDSINIRLENSYLASGAYSSPVFAYQENGFDYALTADNSDGDLAEVTYGLDALKKDSATGIETIYATDVNDNVTLAPRAGLDASIGQFAFDISSVDVDQLTVGAYSYDNMANNEPDFVGFVWHAAFNREALSGEIANFQPTANNAVYENIVLENPANIGLGAEVIIRDHDSFSENGATGIITSLAEQQDGTAIISIEYDNTITSEGSAGTGTLNIIDRFVIAKGRILA